MMADKQDKRVNNILSFEVEDIFHVDSPDYEIEDLKSRIIPILIHLLGFLDSQKARATFFVLGWVASKFPEVVSLIDSRGHEVACHGFSHSDITTMNPEKRKTELRLSKEALENILNKPVLGFKGACDPLGKEHLHILNEIADTGFEYICGVKAGAFAGKTIEPFDSEFKSGRSLKIIPRSAIRKWGVWLHFGEKLRLYPSWFTRRAVNELNSKGYPSMINMKLWELDRHQTRGANSDYTHYRRYGNLNLAEEKLMKLLDVFEFTTCAEILGLEY
jgi:polysaccharide deacetylase family protein (PEP-CTERM system associated)